MVDMAQASRRRVTIGRGPRGRRIMGERALIIVPVTGQPGTSANGVIGEFPPGAEHDPLEDLALECARVASHPADLIEWRVDMFAPFQRARTLSARLSALEQGWTAVESASVPVLATIRTSDEGGAVTLTSQEYRACVKALAQWADAVDVQVGAEGAVELLEELAPTSAVVVASNHDFAATPPEDEVFGTLQQMQILGADIAKVAYAARGPVDLLAVMNAQMRAKDALDVPVIAIAMGIPGAMSRIAGMAVGSAATFATVGAASAPGQFSARQVREALDLMEAELAH